MGSISVNVCFPVYSVTRLGTPVRVFCLIYQSCLKCRLRIALRSLSTAEQLPFAAKARYQAMANAAYHGHARVRHVAAKEQRGASGRREHKRRTHIAVLIGHTSLLGRPESSAASLKRAILGRGERDEHCKSAVVLMREEAAILIIDVNRRLIPSACKAKLTARVQAAQAVRCVTKERRCQWLELVVDETQHTPQYGAAKRSLRTGQACWDVQAHRTLLAVRPLNVGDCSAHGDERIELRTSDHARHDDHALTHFHRCRSIGPSGH